MYDFFLLEIRQNVLTSLKLFLFPHSHLATLTSYHV
nr:MAG TPA: hypothetical protein [Caudoviricetes sp.]